MRTLVLCVGLLAAICAVADDTTTVVVPPQQTPVLEKKETKETLEKCSDAMENFKKKHEDDLEEWKDKVGRMGDMLEKTRLWGEPKKATIIPLTNASPSDMARLLEVFDAEIKPQEEFKAISVKATPDTLATIEQLVKRFDVPMKSKDVELQFYLLTADVPNLPPPPELDAVIAQIKKIYPNYSISMAGTYVVRGCDGRDFYFTDAMQDMPVGFEGRVGISGSDIRLDKFSCRGGVPLGDDLLIQTDLAFSEGQSVVIAKSSVRRDASEKPVDLFLVVSGHIVQE